MVILKHWIPEAIYNPFWNAHTVSPKEMGERLRCLHYDCHTIHVTAFDSNGSNRHGNALGDVVLRN